MIFIDAREGLAGDMLLAGLIGLMPMDSRRTFTVGMERACENLGIGFALLELEDGNDHGLGIAYIKGENPSRPVPMGEASGLVQRCCDVLGRGHETSRRILDGILEAEAKAHSVDKADVHLHEIGRRQAIANIAGIGAAADLLRSLGSGEFVCSTIVTGRGTVVVSHGVIRVPAPASQHLLTDMKHEEGERQGERATPTGVAAVKALIARQEDLAPGECVVRSVGFGTKRFAGRLGRVTLYHL